MPDHTVRIMATHMATSPPGRLKIIMQMEKQVVAVGVENEGEYSLLKRAGISYMQGAYLSMPLSEEELLKKISGNPLKEEKEIMLQ